jgi:hypothetical protein
MGTPPHVSAFLVMVKNAMVSIRVAPEVKERLEKAAMLDGWSVASYVERLLDSLHQSLPRWILRDCYPIHRKDIGPRVVLSIDVNMSGAGTGVNLIARRGEATPIVLSPESRSSPARGGIGLTAKFFSPTPPERKNRPCLPRRPFTARRTILIGNRQVHTTGAANDLAQAT